MRQWFVADAAMAAVVLPLKIASCNPMAANTMERRSELQTELANFDIIALQGMQRKRGYHDETVTICRVEGKAWFDSGWRTGPGTNQSAGCAIVLARSSNGASQERLVLPRAGQRCRHEGQRPGA